MEKFLKGLVVFRQLIAAEKMDCHQPRSHDPWQRGEGWERGGWMMENKEMLQFDVADPHVFKIN